MKCSETIEPIYWLDAFCGAGGASTGIERVQGNRVVIGINHDIRAIEAHRANHPETIHLNDDIRKVRIEEIAEILQSKGIKRINLWWSAECTHLSNAKGGASRDADSRMLSEDMFRYIDGLRRLGIAVDMVMVENVKEFFSWTALVPKCIAEKKRMRQLERQYVAAQIDFMESVVSARDCEAGVLRELIDMLAADFASSGRYVVDEKGKLLMVPHTESKGSMYLKWVRHMEDRGYIYDYKMLNAADFGAFQSRDRYFGVFIHKSVGIRPSFPKPTHAKNPSKAVGDLFDAPLKKWNACREILDLDDRGESILYGRTGKKPLVSATLDRIKYGINKFPGETVLIDRTHTGASPTSVEDPLPTVRANFDNAAIGVAHVDNHSYGANPVSLDDPCPTVMAKRDKYLMQGFVVPSAFRNAPYVPDQPLMTLTANRKHSYLCVPFIANQYTSNGHNQCSSIDGPMWGVTTANHKGLCLPFIVSQFGDSKANEVSGPLGTVTTIPKYSLNSVFFAKYYGTGENVFPVTGPLGTVTTKDRFCMVGTQFVQALTETSKEWPIHIGLNPSGNKFCPAWMRIEGAYLVDNRIVDIHYRMLKVSELKLAQGFPADYQLDSKSETVAKKHIGNAVHVEAARALVSANCGPKSAYVHRLEKVL